MKHLINSDQTGIVSTMCDVSKKYKVINRKIVENFFIR